MEVVNLRVSASSSLGKPRPVMQEASYLPSQPRVCRLVQFLSGPCDTPILFRDDLTAGFAIEGPAIIEEKTSTVVVEPGWRMSLDPLANLVLTRLVHAEE